MEVEVNERRELGVRVRLGSRCDAVRADLPKLCKSFSTGDSNEKEEEGCETLACGGHKVRGGKMKHEAADAPTHSIRN